MFSLKKEEINCDAHPLLPSGEWEGFYCYHHSKHQHRMETDLNFGNSLISGSGVDDIAPFTWSGKYDLEGFKMSVNKIYATHQFIYKGDIDENGIWGIWESVYNPSMPLRMLQFKMTGGFHIWPKKSASESAKHSLSNKASSKKLQEIFVEQFS